MPRNPGPGSTGLVPSGRVRITSKSQESAWALVKVTAPVVGFCLLLQRFLGRVGGALVEVFDVRQVALGVSMAAGKWAIVAE